MSVKVRPAIVQAPCVSGMRRTFAVEVTWDKGDDPEPMLRLLEHWRLCGGNP